MRYVCFLLFMYSNFCYSQNENELQKKDSIFIIFSEGDKQKIYTKMFDKESNELKRIFYAFNFNDGKNCSFSYDKHFNYDLNGKEILKTYKIKKSFLKKNKHKIITFDEINDNGFVNYIDFLQERRVYIIDLAETKGKFLIARGVIFGFAGEE